MTQLSRDLFRSLNHPIIGSSDRPTSYRSPQLFLA
jgi:hypothetical protein